MKNLIALSLAIVLTAAFSLAFADDQDKEKIKKSDLKGPKAKNYHPAKYDLQAVEIQTVKSEHPVNDLKGPKAKNYRPGSFEFTPTDVEHVSGNSERRELKGPKAKNYKPGR